jgi:hypothetical protein
MSLQIDPARLLSQPLMMHHRDPGEYWVIIAGFVAGRVSRYHAADGEALWLWYLTGPLDADQEIARRGDSPSLVAAKEALHFSLQHCIATAARSHKDISWAD